MSALAAAAIGVGGSVIGGAFKFFEGQSQKKQANQIAKNNPFVPEVMPAEVGLQTRLAQENFTNGMPGMNTAQQQIAQNAINAGTISAKGATSGADLIDSANKIQLNSDDATRQLALQAASYKSNALGGYEAALGNQAGWQDKLYERNQAEPYNRAANTSAALTGAGNLNEFGGIDTATQGLGAGAQELNNNKLAIQLAKIKAQGQDNWPVYSSQRKNLDTNSILAISALGAGGAF